MKISAWAPPRLPVAAVQAETDAIVNIAFGGYYALTEDKVWTLRFGFNTDFSPVGDNDKFFTKVDLYALTVGISGETRHFIASLGANYSFGNANNAPLADKTLTRRFCALIDRYVARDFSPIASIVAARSPRQQDPLGFLTSQAQCPERTSAATIARAFVEPWLAIS